jgi:hypothetical protein
VTIPGVTVFFAHKLVEVKPRESSTINRADLRLVIDNGVSCADRDGSAKIPVSNQQIIIC